MSLRRTIAAGSYACEAGDQDRARRLRDDAAQSAAPGPRRARALWRLALPTSSRQINALLSTLYRQALAEAGNDVETRIEDEAGLTVAIFRMRRGSRDSGTATPARRWSLQKLTRSGIG